MTPRHDDDLSSPCADCGIETLPTDERRAEWYHVHPEVWEQTGLGIDDGCLCIGCLETRLGRTLTRADFTDAPVNDLGVESFGRYAWSFRSDRLMNRLGRS